MKYLRAVLALFRSNQVTTVVPLAVFAGLLHLPALLGWAAPGGPVVAQGILYSAWFAWLQDWPFGSAVVALVLVLVQALLINWLVNESRVTAERNWLPAALYVFVASCLLDFQYVSPVLVAVTALPVALRRAFRSYKNADATSEVFDAGLWVAIGGLFYPPMLWLLVALYLGLLGIRAFRLREQLVFLTGAFVPGFLGWTWSFWNDHGGSFRRTHLFNLFQWWGFDLQFDQRSGLQAGLLLLLLVVVLLNTSTYYYKKLMQVQKYINTLYLTLVMTVVGGLLQNEPSVEHFLLAAPAVGIFLGMVFQNVQRRWLAEVLFLALVGATVAIWTVDDWIGVLGIF